MKLDLPDEFVLFDLEYTAWPGSQERKWSGENEYREVIQIGAICVRDLKEIDAFCAFVKPVKNPKLSEYIQELTGISQGDIDTKGLSFQSALAEFLSFVGEIPTYCFGRDTEVLEENGKLLGVEVVLPRAQFHDFRQESGHTWLEKGIDISQYSSGTLVEAFTKKPGLRAHDAVNDMRNLLKAITLFEHA